MSKPLALISSNPADTAHEETSSPVQATSDALDDARSQERHKLYLPHSFYGALIGSLVGFRAGRPLVSYAAKASEPLPARSAIALRVTAIGREVVLVFERGDHRKPIIVGLVEDIIEKASEVAGPIREHQDSLVDVEMDGERLIFTAQREIVIRCGRASITLTRAGKVLIRGAYLLNRSSGVNRIKGGSVQIN
jgi:hypothetical protein